MEQSIEKISKYIESLTSTLETRRNVQNIRNSQAAVLRLALGAKESVTKEGPSLIIDTLPKLKEHKRALKVESRLDLVGRSIAAYEARIAELRRELDATVQKRRAASTQKETSESGADALALVLGSLDSGAITREQAAAVFKNMADENPEWKLILNLVDKIQTSTPAGAAQVEAAALEVPPAKTTAPVPVFASLPQTIQAIEAGEPKPSEEPELLFGSLTIRDVGLLQTVFQHHEGEINDLLRRHGRSLIDEATVTSVRSFVIGFNLPSEEEQVQNEEEQARALRQLRAKALGKARDIIRADNFDEIFKAIETQNGDIANLLILLQDIEQIRTEHPEMPGQLLNGISYLQVIIKTQGRTQEPVTGRAYAIRPSARGNRASLRPARARGQAPRAGEPELEIAARADEEARARLRRNIEPKSGLPPGRAETAAPVEVRVPTASDPHPHLRLILSDEGAASHIEPTVAPVPAEAQAVRAPVVDKEAARRAALEQEIRDIFDIILRPDCDYFGNFVAPNLSTGKVTPQSLHTLATVFQAVGQSAPFKPHIVQRFQKYLSSSVAGTPGYDIENVARMFYLRRNQNVKSGVLKEALSLITTEWELRLRVLRTSVHTK